MFGMNPRMGGLFGARKPFGTPGIGDGHREQMGMPPMGNPGLGMEAQQPKMGLGTKLLGQGWEGKLGDIGAILQDNSGQAYDRIQERRTAPLVEQMKRQAEYDDFVRKEQWKRDNPAPSDSIDIREDNAGNMWRFDKRTGQALDDKPVFVDRAGKTIVHDGMRIDVPNPFLPGTQGGGGVPTVADEAGYNAVPPGAQYRDPSGNLRTKQGGPTQQPASGTFPGRY